MSIRNSDRIHTQRIHPAIDFTAEHAYIGQMIHGRNRENNLWIIRDDGRITTFRGNNLEQNGIELIHSSLCIGQRWTVGSILNFSRGETEIAPKAQLFHLVKDLLHLYTELPDERLYDLLTLWSLGTYFSQLFNTYPYLYVGGISQSGKTKLLTLCSHLCFNSILGSNMSTATIFRLVQNARCSLFIDETENLSQREMNQEFRNLLLNGYKKGLRTYRNRRTDDGNFVPEAFEVYGPKMFANIEGIEDILESRCLTITMRRSSNSLVTSREVLEIDPVWQEIRDDIYPFQLKNWKAIKQAYSEFKNDTTLANRNLELWKPILSLAKFFDETLYTEMKALASEMAEQSQIEDSDSQECMLVEALLSLMEDDGYYRVRYIKEAMAALFEECRWIDERHVGRLLRRLGFRNKRRTDGRYEYFLRTSEVVQFARNLGITVDSGHSGLSGLTSGQGSNGEGQNTGGNSS